MATATPKKSVTRSAQINLADVTLEDISAGATTVGAPKTAKVTTGGGSPTANPEDYLPYSVTYTWTEEV